MKQILEDVFGPVQLSIVESTDGRLVARGEFGFCGRPTANGRVYPRKLIEREIGRLRPKMENSAMYGELDHPESGKTSLKRVSHLISNLTIESNGRVVGEMSVLDHPDIPNGRLLKGLVECGVKLGVSSRGIGSVKKQKDGNYLVQEDFRLLTYDVVADPAWSDAVPAFTREENEYHHEAEGYMTLEELQQKYPDIMEAARRKAVEATKAEFGERIEQIERNTEAKMAEAIERFRSESGDEGPLPEDADLLTQRVRMQEGAIQQKDRRIRELKADLRNAQISEALRDALHGVPEQHRAGFVGLLGESSLYPTIEAFNDRLGVVVDEFKSTGRYHAVNVEESASLQASLDEAKEIMQAARQEIIELHEQVARRDDLLAEARQDTKEAQRRAYRSETLLEEAQESIQDLQEQVSLAGDSSQESLQESLLEAESLQEDLEEKDIELYKYESVIGLPNPNEMLGRLSGAQTREDVDAVLGESGEARRPVEPDVPASSNGSMDYIFEDDTRDKIFRVANEEFSPVIPESTLSAPSDIIVEGVTTPNRSRSRGGDSGFRLPGLSPAQLEGQVRGE